MLRPWFAQAARALPSQCVVCHAWPSQSICGACLNTFAASEPRCERCALPLPAAAGRLVAYPATVGEAGHMPPHPSYPRVCGACLRLAADTAAPLDTCLAAVPYAYPWSNLLTRFKFRGEPGLATRLAGLMRQIPQASQLLADCALVLPMPLSNERLRERGFNQALLLARALSASKTDADLLLRLRHTRPQSELPREQRLHNLQGAFGLAPLRAHEVAGRHVLLVDDVMTTGASLQNAAQALRLAGAQRVDALVLARTPDSPGVLLSVL